MILEILLNISYAAASIILAIIIKSKFRYIGPPDFTGSAFWFLIGGGMYLVGFGLAPLFGFIPPVLFHALRINNWSLPLMGSHSLLLIGPVGNLCQLVGAGAWLLIYIRAWPLAVGVGMMGAWVLEHFNINI